MTQGAYIALYYRGYLGVVYTNQDGEVDKLGKKIHDTLTTVEDVEAVIEAGSVESFYLISRNTTCSAVVPTVAGRCKATY